MIRTENLTKRFDKTLALNDLSCSIPDGSIYGLVGSNGAGKSTFLRLITGIYRPTSGSIDYDGKAVFDNPEIKSRIAFVPDELYFASQSSLNEMAKLYGAIYPNFSYDRFKYLVGTFMLPCNSNINTFSKGMRRQAAIILALSAMPDYLFFDESFDGLDPIIRNLVKQLIYNDVAERGTTVIISSHSLRELEDTCDQLALLHKGGLVLESDVQNLKTSLYKVQIAFSQPFDKEQFRELDPLEYSQNGSVAVLIARGNKDAAVEKLKAMNPTLLDVLPLTLEEVFVHELSALGYSFNSLGLDFQGGIEHE